MRIYRFHSIAISIFCSLPFRARNASSTCVFLARPAPFAVHAQRATIQRLPSSPLSQIRDARPPFSTNGHTCAPADCAHRTLLISIPLCSRATPRRRPLHSPARWRNSHRHRRHHHFSLARWVANPERVTPSFTAVAAFPPPFASQHSATISLLPVSLPHRVSSFDVRSHRGGLMFQRLSHRHPTRSVPVAPLCELHLAIRSCVSPRLCLPRASHLYNHSSANHRPLPPLEYQPWDEQVMQGLSVLYL